MVVVGDDDRLETTATEEEECCRASTRWDDAVARAWMDGVRATMRAWIARYFAPGDGVEFIWRGRLRTGVLREFVTHEPWIDRANRYMLRELLVEGFEACGYTCVLATRTSCKVRMRLPDGTVRRVTGVVTGIRRRPV